ncbi:unnamed protein product [Tuber aestivum]|uniref:Uncharacterized protein n=1 Tax=Tuber aestivum TaxID=59557 RepID=A0A292PXQ4_9PEZI|nr:unnamed protein product [Tuber aestivum]
MPSKVWRNPLREMAGSAKKIKKGADRSIRNGQGVTASELSLSLRRDDSSEILRLAEVGALEELGEEAVVPPVLPPTKEPVQELVALPAKERGEKLRWRVWWNLWCLGGGCGGEWEAGGDDEGGDRGGDRGGDIGRGSGRSREERHRGGHGRGQSSPREHHFPRRRGRYQTPRDKLLTAGPDGDHGCRSPRRTDAYSTHKEEGKRYSVVVVR